MQIITRVLSLGSAGANIQLSLEVLTDTGILSGGEATVDPSWSEPQIEEMIAEGAREGVRQTGATVAEDTPVTIIGGVSKV